MSDIDQFIGITRDGRFVHVSTTHKSVSLVDNINFASVLPMDYKVGDSWNKHMGEFDYNTKPVQYLLAEVTRTVTLL